MGSLISKGKEEIGEKQIQAALKTYWDLKKCVEDQTVKFLTCVDVLESASAHILSCHDKNNGDQDKQFRLDTQTRKLLFSSKVIEEDDRQLFLNKIIEFVDFVSSKVSELKPDHVYGNIKCEIQDKYSERYVQSDHCEDKIDVVDALKKQIEHLQNDIVQRDKENKLLREGNDRLSADNKDVENHNDAINKKFMSAMESCRKLKQQNDLLEEKLDSCKTGQDKLTEYEEKMRQLTEKNLSKVTTLEQKLKEKDECLHKLTTQHEKDKNDLEKLKAEFSALLKQKLELKEKLDNDNSEAECKFTELKTILDKAQKEKHDVDDELKQLKGKLETCVGDKCKMEAKISKLKEDLVNSNNECVSLKGKLNVSSIQLSKANEKNNEIDKELLQMNDILKKKQVDLDQCDIEKQKALQDLDQIRNTLAKCKKEQKDTETNLKLVFENLDKREKECEASKSELRLLHDKYDLCTNEKDATESQLKQAIQDLESTRKKLDKASQDLESTRTKLDKAYQDLKSTETELKLTVKDYESTEARFVSLQKEHRTMELDHRDKVQCLESKVRTHEYNERKLTKDLQTCHSEKKTLLDEIMECRSSYKELSDKLNDMNSKRIIKLKLFAVRRPNTLADFEDAVIAMLKSRIDDDKKELAFEQNDNPDVVNTDTDPTIILCFCGSRIGTDAEKAVEGLNLSPKMALVMIHHKDVHALPTQLSERVITGPEYKKLHLITDMAFLRDKGIYPCEINNNSVVKLVNFIKTEGKEYMKY